MIPFFLLFIFISPLLVIAIQCVLNRIKKGAGQINALISIVLGSLPFLLFISGVVPENEQTAGFFIYSLLLYFITSYAYFHFFNMSETARRIRLISAIGEGKIKDLDEIPSLFVGKDLVQARLDRLMKLGQISLNSGKYKSTSHFIPMVARVLRLWSWIIGKPWKI